MRVGTNPFATQIDEESLDSDYRSLILEIAKESGREAAKEAVRAVLEGLSNQTVVAPEFLTVEHAGMYIDKSKDAMTCLLKQGQIPIIKIGTRVYIAKKDLDTYMLNHRQ